MKNCVVLEFLHCLIVNASNHVLMMYHLHYEKIGLEKPPINCNAGVAHEPFAYVFLAEL